MAYLITLGEESDFRINVEDFKNQLLSDWQSVQFENVKIPNDPLLLHWSLEIAEDTQLGALHPDNQTISIDGFPPSVARFTIWYRQKVPATHKLFLFHDSASVDDDIEVTTETKEEELLERLNYL